MVRDDMEEERRGGEGGCEGGGLMPPSASADSAYAVRWAQRGLLLCEQDTHTQLKFVTHDARGGEWLWVLFRLVCYAHGFHA